MFDWNDEELSNIIWDEAGESDDHIVPYPQSVEDYNKKKDWNQESNNNKSNEHKAPGAKVDIHGRKLESSSNFNTSEGASASGCGLDSWPNLSLSTAAKTDQDSLDTSLSNSLTEITKFETSGGAETVQLGKDTEIFQKDKEQGEFVDYGWANIGSFDDLDRIFSNDDPIFGNASLSNPDELWPSSKDVTSSPGKSFPIYSDSPTLGLGSLRNASEQFEIKTEYVQEDDQPFTLDYGKVSDPASHSLQNAHNVLNQVEYAGGKSKALLKEQTNLTMMRPNSAANSQLTTERVAAPNELAEKVYKQKKPLKGRKKLEEQRESALYQDFYGNWSPAGNLPGQYKNQFAPNIAHHSSVLNQSRQLQGPESLQFQQMSNPLMAPSAYGTITKPYSAMPVLSHMQSGEYKHPPVFSVYEVSSGGATANKSADSSIKSQTMTPQEKIEKLRKRQQMQAMLAIQKQQQQFGHQVSSSDQSLTPKSSQENQIQQVEGTELEVEDLSSFPAFDPNSPLEQDDSSTIPLAVTDYSAEDTVLYRLQEIIAKLDVRIRLCIRDSLFRLAQSAVQRHYASDTCSTNNSSRDEKVSTKDDTGAPNRNAKMSEVETETNPIDRTVAHLLFHRPMELSPGKHRDTPESPASTKFLREQKALSIAKPSIGCFPETEKSKQIISHQGSKVSYTMADPQLASQCKSTICIDTSGNASNNGPADEGVKDVEASQ